MTEENLTPYIPIGTLFKYLLKDYRRERQRTIHMEAQVRSLLKRNAYLEQEIGKVKQRLLKKVEKSEKQIDYSQEISRLHQAVSCRNNTIEQLRNENARLKNELDTYLLFLGKIKVLPSEPGNSVIRSGNIQNYVLYSRRYKTNQGGFQRQAP